LIDQLQHEDRCVDLGQRGDVEDRVGPHGDPLGRREFLRPGGVPQRMPTAVCIVILPSTMASATAPAYPGCFEFCGVGLRLRVRISVTALVYGAAGAACLTVSATGACSTPPAFAAAAGGGLVAASADATGVLSAGAGLTVRALLAHPVIVAAVAANPAPGTVRRGMSTRG
jgi:hypothetical protein